MLNLYIIQDTFNGFSTNFLYLIALIAIFSGIFIIITKNPIVSVLYLILLFSSISCYLIFVGIKFIGLTYILVYVGAVSILFLFILMLINIRVSELISDTNNNIPLAILAIIAFFIPFSNLVPDTKYNLNESFSFNNILESITNSSQISYVTSNSWDSNLVDISDIISIGNIMYTSYSIWLLITSIILLLAMVGSIVITIKQKN
jgi:NADH-ubiquinone oxidoreductase chain 6